MDDSFPGVTEESDEVAVWFSVLPLAKTRGQDRSLSPELSQFNRMPYLIAS